MELGRDGTLRLAVPLGRDVGSATASSDPVEDGHSVAAAVSDQIPPWRDTLDEARHGSPDPSTTALIFVLSQPGERPMA